MTEPRNPPAYAELLAWMEEAVEYVNKGTRSPSLETEGRKLLRLATTPAPATAAAPDACLKCGASWQPHVCRP